MTIERVIEVIKHERECVIRNINNECDRDCAKCDLLLPDNDIICAYDYSLNLLNELKASEKE